MKFGVVVGRFNDLVTKLLLEGKFMPNDQIAISVDPIRAPGEFMFAATPAA